MAAIGFQRNLNPNSFSTFAELAKGMLRNNYGLFYDDFSQAASSTLPSPWAKQDTSAAGTPTMDYVNARNGVYRITHDATSEAQNLTLYWGDHLTIPGARPWVFEAGVGLNTAGATMSADQRCVIGMASARNATLDSIVSNAWFRLEGANLNIYTETDDGTTDTDDRDSGLDFVDATVHRYLIDATQNNQVRFYVDLADGNGWQESTGGSHAATAWALTDRMQPYFEIQRDAGTEAEAFTIDYCALAWAR